MPIDPRRPLPKSIRLPNYDYAGNALYFITICTAGREMLFGEVRNGAMAMNEFGWIVWEEWERSAEIRLEIELDVFVVMPNHFHALVTIVPAEPVAAHGVRLPAEMPASTQNKRFADEGARRAPLRRSPRSLGSLVAGFKAATTSKINVLRGIAGPSVWQPNYYERIVRNEHAHARIASYVEFNAMQWSIDRENPARVGDNAFESWLFAEPRASNRSP
jgi:putative transposase